MSHLSVAIRLDCLRMPLRRALDHAARMGVSMVELDGRGEIHPESISQTGLRQIRNWLDERNLKVAALRFQTRRGFEVADGLQRRVEATKAAMKLAYQLGTSHVINQIGYIPDDASDPRHETLQTVISDLGRFGAKVGAFLAAETGAESGERLMEAIAGDEEGYVAVAFNPGQLIVNRFSVAEALDALKERIGVLCVTDGVLDLAAGRGIAVPVGEGTADFPQIFAQLEDVDFHGPCVVGRADSQPRDLEQGTLYLRNLYS